MRKISDSLADFGANLLNNGLNTDQIAKLNHIALEVHEWAVKNFNGTPTPLQLLNADTLTPEGQVAVIRLGHLAPLMGMVEEYGELSMAGATYYVNVEKINKDSINQLEVLKAKYRDSRNGDTPSLAEIVPHMKDVADLSEQTEIKLNTERRLTEEELEDSIGDFGVYFCDYISWLGVNFFDVNIMIPTIIAEWLDKGHQDKEMTKSLLGDTPIHLGRLYHIELKRLQKIRGMNDPNAFKHRQLHALSSLFVSWAVNAIELGFDPLKALETTWAKVKERDWKKNQQNGNVSVESSSVSSCS